MNPGPQRMSDSLLDRLSNTAAVSLLCRGSGTSRWHVRSTKVCSHSSCQKKHWTPLWNTEIFSKSTLVLGFLLDPPDHLVHNLTTRWLWDALFPVSFNPPRTSSSLTNFGVSTFKICRKSTGIKYKVILVRDKFQFHWRGFRRRLTKRTLKLWVAQK